MEKQLSEHFSYDEAVITNHRDIDNFIPFALMGNAINTAKGMERVRACLGDLPITVSSWYRNPELNKRVGGSKTSQHMKAEAVDWICPKFGNPVAIVKHLAENHILIRFDQLILEHTWVHISFNSIPGVKQRNQVLTLLASGGYAPGITDKHGNPL